MTKDKYFSDMTARMFNSDDADLRRFAHSVRGLYIDYSRSAGNIAELKRTIAAREAEIEILKAMLSEREG